LWGLGIKDLFQATQQAMRGEKYIWICYGERIIK
jgi:hypothetical protein